MGDLNDFIAAIIDHRGDLAAVALACNLTPRQVRARLADPAVQRKLAAFESFKARLRRLRALDHLDAAADTLRDCLRTAPNPTERRRAAAELARTTQAILSASNPAAPRRSAGSVPQPPKRLPPPPPLPAEDYAPYGA